jgi:hypothetical protein
MALPAMAALPSGVRGPVEAWALLRLASIFFRDGMDLLLQVSGRAGGHFRGLSVSGLY